MDVDTLLKMSESQLDDLFSKSTAGPIPDGAAKGTAIIAPGTTFSPAIAQAISFFTWQGKSQTPARRAEKRISVLGLNAIVAEAHRARAGTTRRECIVLDYSKTSTVAGWIRDEIRQLEPGTYLGKVYGHEKPLIHFALQFP